MFSPTNSKRNILSRLIARKRDEENAKNHKRPGAEAPVCTEGPLITDPADAPARSGHSVREKRTFFTGPSVSALVAKSVRKF